MKKAVKHQNVHFIIERAAGFARIAPCDGRRDGNVAQIRTVAIRQRMRAARRFRNPSRDALFSCARFRWERQHVRGLRFAAIEAIPASDLRVGDQAYGGCAGGNMQKPGDTSEELLQRRRSNRYTSLAVDDHGSGINPLCRDGRIRATDYWPRRDCRAARRHILRRP